MKQKLLIKIVGFCKILIFVTIFLLNLLTKFLEKLNLNIEKLVVIQTRNTIKTSVFSFELVGTRNFRHSKKSAAGQIAGTRVWNSESPGS